MDRLSSFMAEMKKTSNYKARRSLKKKGTTEANSLSEASIPLQREGDDDDNDIFIEPVTQQHKVDLQSNIKSADLYGFDALQVRMASTIAQITDENTKTVLVDMLGVMRTMAYSVAYNIPVIVGMPTDQMNAEFKRINSDGKLRNQYFLDGRAPTKKALKEGLLTGSNKLCCYYHSMCYSKEFINKKWISGRAETCDMRLLALEDIRSVNAKDAKKVLISRAVCSMCRIKLLPNDMAFTINNNPCLSCLVTSTNDPKIGVYICRACKSEQSNSTNHDANMFLETFMKCLKYVVPGMTKFSISMQECLGNRRPDMLIRGEIHGLSFSIIIEKDEKGHQSYTLKDEKIKDIAQISAEIIVKQCVTRSDDKWRLLCVRCNPTGDNAADEILRFCVLRRWIIWWLNDLVKKRHFIMMYLFYNDSRTHLFEFEQEDTGCSKKKRKLNVGNDVFTGRICAQHPPKPSTVNWAYCAFPQEFGILPDDDPNNCKEDDIGHNWLITKDLELPETIWSAIANRKKNFT